MNDAFDKSDAGPFPHPPISRMGRGEHVVDRLLREYYETEMPHPWPRLSLPPVRAAGRPANRAIRPFFRFALAASVVVALLGYWLLAGQFGGGGNRPALNGSPEIGDKAGHRPPIKHLVPIERQRTPGGNDAQVFEEGTPGGNVMILIGPTNSKSLR
jgi:hypothetical protein